MRLSDTPLIARQQIEARLDALAQEIARDAAGKDLLAVTVLKGGIFFASDLLRRLPGPVSVDFVRCRSYVGTQSHSTPDISYSPETSLHGRHVLLIEDILDTGRTTSAILAHFQAQAPASLKVCALLDKPARRIVAVAADYVGFRIEDHFVVGYGLDYDELYRELPEIYCLIP
jgi:hypoxanthine phosphoribosyltransferase